MTQTSGNWRDMRRITAEAAEREPEASRLFGPGYEARQQELAQRGLGGVNRNSFEPWGKPKMQRKRGK